MTTSAKSRKLTTRELPHLAKTAKITVRENNGVYSIWFADKKSLHSSSLRCCCFSQNTHVSHDQCGRFPNHSTTGSVKYHVTDNFAVFLATEFTLQNSRVVTREDRKIARWLASFRATSLAVFRMRFCVHIENTATKNLKVWNTAVFHCKWEWPYILYMYIKFAPTQTCIHVHFKVVCNTKSSERKF